MSSNNKKCLTRPTRSDLIPIELHYYSFMFSVDKCNGSCNAVDDLCKTIRVLSLTKGTNVNLFNKKTRINEVKTLVRYI